MIESQDIRRIMDAIALTLGAPKGDYRLSPFTYSMNFIPATLSATTTSQFIVQNDSAFAICKTTATVSTTAEVFSGNISDTPMYSPFVITLTDSGSGRNFSDNAIPINSLFGSAKEPFIWTVPLIVAPASTIAGALQNLVATSFNVRLAFHGYKIFGNLEAFRRTHEGA